MIDFYKNLPVQAELSSIFDEDRSVPVPEDWHIAVTDVVGSTKAIEAGRYKDVNVAGGLAVIAVSNGIADMEFPFVFGGDGVTILIPGEVRDRVGDILFDTREQVQALYGLDLRVGIVPVRTVLDRGCTIALSKLRVSEYYDQAIIRGNGALEAENLVKSKTSDAFRIKARRNSEVRADFSGFTCRWKDIPSPQGETISLVLQLREAASGARTNEIYMEILSKIEEIFGAEEEYHPLSEENLEMTSDNDFLGREAKALSGRSTGPAYLGQLLRIKMESYVTRLAIRFKLAIKAFWYDLSQLKKFQMLSCDFRKYDGTLKMVIACTSESRGRLEKYLAGLFQTGRIYYGIHTSDRALMTCVLHEQSEREVHFVDAADGGYALAARQLKKQMAADG